MNLIDFHKTFPNEDACIEYFKAKRESQGIVCDKCGCTHHYWKSYRNQWQCKKCGHRTGLKAGTVMHSSKLPLLTWFITIHLITSTKKSFSAAELQRQLGISCYQTVWEMLHKIRGVMGKRDSRYKLNGSIELDDAFFTISLENDKEGEKLKRGRGSQRKAKVLVIAESQKSEKIDSRKKIQKSVGHIKMIVINDFKSPTLDKEVVKWINSDADITTDDSKSYVNFKNLVKSHTSQVVEPKDLSKVLPWVHIVISNAKRQLLDIHHDIQPEFLQSYLDEFCYKFNRRNLDVFERVMFSCVGYKNEFKHRIYSKSA